MKLLDGIQAAHAMRAEIAEKIKQAKRSIGLAVVMVGENHASKIYIATKKRACEAVGITSTILNLHKTTSEKTLIEAIEKLNSDSAVDGILVQTPLPPQVSTSKIFETIDPHKDVDGFHPINMGKLLMGEGDGLISCTPLGIQKLLTHYRVPTQGKRVIILGRSNIVGKPLAALLMQKGSDATVTVAHSKSEGLHKLCQEADILIAAIGSPNFVGPEMIKKGAVVVDVGINRVNDPHREKGYRVVGDVDFEKVQDKCDAITPVPGGVGPMTVATLLSNTLRAHSLRSA